MYLKSICLTSLLAATTRTWRPVLSRCSSSWLLMLAVVLSQSAAVPAPAQ
jgi:hypothetical protein